MRNSIFFVMVVASLGSGCGAKLPSMKPFKMEVQQGNVVTSKMLLQLRPGMTRSQVRYIMGTPLVVDSFRDNRWDYFYELRKQGSVVEKRRVILDFDKDSLVAVRGDVIASPENPEVKTIAEAPKQKVEEPKEEGWTDKLKFWKTDEASEGQPSEATTKAAAADAARVEGPSATNEQAQLSAAQAAPTEARTPEAASPAVADMAAQAAEAVQPPPVFEQEPKAAPTVVAEPEPVLPPPVKAPEAKSVLAPISAAAATPVLAAASSGQAKTSSQTETKVAEAKPAAIPPSASTAEPAIEDGEVVPYIPEGEYVAPVIPTTDEMVKGNMAEANAPAVDADAHQVTEKGMAPKDSREAEPPPTFIAEQLPEPEPEPEPELPPPPVKAKESGSPVAPAAALAATEPASLSQAAESQADPVENAPQTAQTVESEINQAVAGWAQAWRSKNIKVYLAAYAPEFVPEGLSNRSAWEAQRKQRLSPKQGQITLVLNNVQVHRDGDEAIVQFEQKYAAKAYKDELLKTLEMRYEPAQKRWLITRERTAPLGSTKVPATVDLPEKTTVAEAPAVSEPATEIPVATEPSVEAAIQAWAQAWRTKNINAYLAAYSPEFVPEGLPSKRAWEAQRKQRLSPKQGKITLEIDAINVERDGDSAMVTFRQKYAAKSYRDEMVKRLHLKLDPASKTWLIVRETAATGADIPAPKQEVTAPDNSQESLDGTLEQIGF